jgi:hypothetical protein
MQTVAYATNVVKTALQGKEHFTNIAKELTIYAQNMTNAIKGKEAFVNPNGQVSEASPLAVAGLIFYILFAVVLFVLYSYGAARMSYCYNIHLGTDSGTALFWSVLAFFFSSYYYPIYGVFLDPLCDIKKQMGGRRR